MISMSIEREFFFTYAAVKNLNYNFSALKDLTVSITTITHLNVHLLKWRIKNVEKKHDDGEQNLDDVSIAYLKWKQHPTLIQKWLIRPS